MLLQEIRIVVVEGLEAAFEEALLEVRQRVFTSPGYRGFTVGQGLESASAYLVQVRWESREELAAHAGSDRMERCWAPIEPFLALPLRIDHYLERAGLDLNGPGVVTDMAWLRD